MLITLCWKLLGTIYCYEFHCKIVVEDWMIDCVIYYWTGD